MQRWLRTIHTNAFNFPNEPSYEQYINRVWNLTHSNEQENLIRGILARYELLKPVPGYASTKSPRVIAWRKRLESNFKRKYIPRRTNRLSSRELYAFLKGIPMQYLKRIALNAPVYV